MILVTGAAGYIGSHVLRSLEKSGIPSSEIVVLDNLYSGHLWAIPETVNFIKGSTGDSALLEQLFSDHKIESIFHFAAHIEVEESVFLPGKYYQNNFVNSSVLIDAAYKAGVDNFVFSSTAAVVGNPEELPIKETAPEKPESPYGRSKLMTEWYLKDKLQAAQMSDSHKMNFVALRYFNVCGAHIPGGLGQATPKATHLIKVACEVATGIRSEMNIYGTDYPTPDGTCVRDYIHVDDLARAHVMALKFLEKNKTSETINLGYGHGHSVLEVINAMNNILGRKLPTKFAPRRAGDAACIYADNSKAKKLLNWSPEHDDIELICKTALDWEEELKTR